MTARSLGFMLHKDSWLRVITHIVTGLAVTLTGLLIYAGGASLDLYPFLWPDRVDATFNVLAVAVPVIWSGVWWLRSRAARRALEPAFSDDLPLSPLPPPPPDQTAARADQSRRLQAVRAAQTAQTAQLAQLEADYAAERDLSRRLALGEQRQAAQAELAVLTEDIRRLSLGLPDSQPPYKGLLFFEEADAPLFFGRATLVAELVERLTAEAGLAQTPRFLAIIGASGSGKSSLVRAGLLPRLRAQGWQPHTLTPTGQPLTALAVALTRDQSPAETQALVEALRADSGALDLVARRQTTGNQPYLLVVDQFEELFTALPKTADEAVQAQAQAERQAFIDNLMAAVAPETGGPTWVILTLRADFYHRLADYPALRQAVESRQKYIGAMTPQELQQAIEAPATTLGYVFDDGLAAQIVRDSSGPDGQPEPGALPLLSHALLQTWLRRDGDRLTLAAYAAAGRVQGAIAQTAETTYARLTPEQRAISRHIFLRLTEFGDGAPDTRRRVARRELPAGEAVADVLQRLADDRLISLDRDNLEVAHEALIREWPRLRRWLADDRAALLWQRRLTEAADAWDKSGREGSYLWQGARLAEAQALGTEAERAWNPLEQAFVAAGRQRARRLRAEQAAGGLAFVAILTTFILVQARSIGRLNDTTGRLAHESTVSADNLSAAQTAEAAAQRNADLAATEEAAAQTAEAAALRSAELAVTREAETQAALQIAQSQALAAAAQGVSRSDPLRALLLGVEAGRRASTAAAFDTLHTSLPTLERPRLTLTHEGWANGAAWNGDESRLLTWSADNMARVWDVADGALWVRLTHEGPVNGAAWNGDESRLLTWSDDKTARVWDAADGKPLLTLTHEGPVSGAAWNGDESRLLTWSQDGTARVWDAADGALLLTLTHESWVYGAAWNGDESRLLTWSDDNTARVWDAADGALLLTLTHEGDVNGAAWNEDESRLLTWSEDGTARVWDTVDGALLLTLTHEDWVFSGVKGAAWNGDESRLLTWSGDGTARVWDTVDGALLLTLTHEDRIFGGVYGAVWNGDESRLLTWSADDTARVWDAANGALRLTLTHKDFVNGAAWNGDESRLLTWSDDGTARVWDAADGALRLTLTHEADVNGAAWNGDESRLLTWSEDGTARVWDADDGALLLTPPHEAAINGAAWNGDESRLLTWSWDNTARVWDAADGALLLTLTHDSVVGAAWNGDESRLLTWSYDNTARVWDADDGALLLTLTHEDWVVSFVNGAAWNGDESRLLTWSEDGTARVWDAADGELLLTLTHEDNVQGAAWNGDESRLLTWSDDGTARVWDAADGSLRLMLTHETSIFGGVNGAAWNGDESRILTWDGDLLANSGTARVWDAADGALLLTLTHEDRVNGAAWNGDESRLLTWSGDGTARVWDAADGALLLTLTHEDSLYGAAWNGDESRILTWDGDLFANSGTAQVWNAASGALLLTLAGDGSSVAVARWSADGRHILLVTENGLVRRYFTDMSELLAVACQRATRNLTWTEWQLYLPGEPYRVTCDSLPPHASACRADPSIIGCR